MSKYIFPIIMICPNLGQAIVMAVHSKPINSVYWIAAAVLNITVTMMGE